MIETDKELQWQMERINSNLRSIDKECKIYNILKKINPFYLVLTFILNIKGLISYVSNISLYCLLCTIMLFFQVYLWYIINESFENKINKVISKQEKLNKEREELLDFIAYLYACRNIESIENGNNLYPDLRYNDSLHVKEQYRDMYEEKRIEYEKQHESRLKLNKKI